MHIHSLARSIVLTVASTDNAKDALNDSRSALIGLCKQLLPSYDWGEIDRSEIKPENEEQVVKMWEARFGSLKDPRTQELLARYEQYRGKLR